MAQPWDEVRGEIRAALLDTSTLVRAVAAGRRRGVPLQWRRAELRPVALKGGVRLQVTAYDETQAHTSNHDAESAGAAVDALLEQGFGNWHVETAAAVIQVRITKKGDAQVHRSVRGEPVEVAPATHDRVKQRLFDVEHPDVRAFLTAVGVADQQGRIKPSRQDKYIQVEEFVRLLDTAVEDARTAGALAEPTPENPWHLVDLGCGHAYLTVGAYVWLAKVRGLPVRWQAPVVLAAPCCHHDLQAQVARGSVPAPYAVVTRHGLLRERLVDVLTDAIRASILRLCGYRVDAVEFVSDEHTPRNLLLRAVRTGAAPSASDLAEHDALVADWGVAPVLAAELADELEAARGRAR